MKRFPATLVLLCFEPAAAQSAGQALAETSTAGAEAVSEPTTHNLNFVWTLIAAVLVFFMQAGFALVETGFTRSKNAVNIIMKNVMAVSAAHP